jgi:hypothetical protein
VVADTADETQDDILSSDAAGSDTPDDYDLKLEDYDAVSGEEDDNDELFGEDDVEGAIHVHILQAYPLVLSLYLSVSLSLVHILLSPASAAP